MWYNSKMAKPTAKAHQDPEESNLEVTSTLPETTAQAADVSATPIRDIISATTAEATKEELELERVRDSIERYTGTGFSERAQETAELTEYLQRLGKDKGRYFGNIVHQGVRDHFGKDDHIGGMGEYDAEMNSLIKDNNLRSRFCRQKKDPEYLAKVKTEVLRIMAEKGLSPQAAFQEYAETELSLKDTGPQGITDPLAVHLSSNSILNHFYGAETDNEAFIILPENLSLARRQYHSRAVDTDYSRDTMYNDVYIWPEQEVESSISLNGGIIFVPRDNNVDEQNGSLYEIENGEVVIDIDKIAKFHKAISNLDKSDYQNYRKEVIKAGKTLGFDENKLNRISNSNPQATEEKERIESMFNGAELEEIKKYTQTVLLVNSRTSNLAMALASFSKPEELREESRHLPKEILADAGFNVEMLTRIFKDPVKKTAIEDFTQRYMQYYRYLAQNSAGFFYKPASKTTTSKKYYEKIIFDQLKDIKIREIKADNQDIVEYRGHDEEGKERVYRVVYYTNTDPSQAVRKFYQDLGIKFDDRVIDDTSDETDKKTRDTKRTSYDEVQYRYDYNQLKANVLSQI